MAKNPPPLASVPPASIRLSLAYSEWQACLEIWLSFADLHLRLSATDFVANNEKKDGLGPFLTSLYRETAHIKPNDSSLLGPQSQKLRELGLLLTNRCIFDTNATQTWLVSLDFLTDFSRSHPRSTTTLSKLLSGLWTKRRNDLETLLQKRKDQLTLSLEAPNPSTGMTELESLVPLLRGSSDAGIFFMLGSDFVSALQTAYEKSNQISHRKALVGTAFSCLSSLLRTEPPKLSLLSDHLYNLKSGADKQPGKASLLADVVTNSPLLATIRQALALHPTERLSKLLNTLETYRMPSIAYPRAHNRAHPSKTSKGKSKASDNEYHIHRLTLVTQIQDLFPDLGSAFILRLLDEYNENVEQVTAHLLDDSLPPHLSTLDRTAQAEISTTEQSLNNLAPRSTPPPSTLKPQTQPFVPANRKNVYDDDDLSALHLGTQRLHIGKTPEAASSTNTTSNKAAILSALAAFDSDDDERDDTYDVDDVGGTVDTTQPETDSTMNEIELVLFAAWKADRSVFGRGVEVRRGAKRAEIKRETGWSDEQVEGWGVMLEREPGRLRGLERKASEAEGRGVGQQGELRRSRYRGGDEDTEGEESGNGGRGGMRGRGGRGGGRGGGPGREGNVAGPSGEAGTANAQRRKEANKGSRANHNRRDQRAKKMARGGFAG